jgi:hypothetical protein
VEGSWECGNEPFGFLKMRSSLVAMQLMASQVVLSSIEIFSVDTIPNLKQALAS